MYTGTLIRDLTAAVERAEQKVEQQRVAEAEELRAIFAMQIPVVDDDRIFMGAA
ncbi:MAG TPA: hypothetical protein VMG31_04970 [Verrucomicrobiae bacterium]|nr:hypothetical protein [Verrucomicrobiae bacterium]